MYAIKTEKLTKKYKEKTAVSNLDLKINEGEMYGLLGVNGAGKTTTMKMLTTLIMPTSGEAELLGHSIKTDRAAVKQIIGISPQESAAAMNLTARENLELMAEVYGFSKRVAKAKASELIERFSMREFENRKAKKLSGGEVRRLSIAMALISEPKILFLDEPTLGLDVIARDTAFGLRLKSSRVKSPLFSQRTISKRLLHSATESGLWLTANLWLRVLPMSLLPFRAKKILSRLL